MHTARKFTGYAQRSLFPFVFSVMLIIASDRQAHSQAIRMNSACIGDGCIERTLWQSFWEQFQPSVIDLPSPTPLPWWPPEPTKIP